MHFFNNSQLKVNFQLHSNYFRLLLFEKQFIIISAFVVRLGQVRNNFEKWTKEERRGAAI
jgi:hypothetical protein